MNDVSALQAALDLLADAAHDYITTTPDASGGLAQYQNLLPDVLALVPKIGQIPAEVKGITLADGVTLVSALAARVSIPDDHAEKVLTAALEVLKLIPALATSIENLHLAVASAKTK